MLTFFGLSLFSFHFALLSFFVAAFFRLTHFFALLGLVQFVFCPLPLAAHNVRIGRSRTHWNSILNEVKCVPRERFTERVGLFLSRARSLRLRRTLTHTHLHLCNKHRQRHKHMTALQAVCVCFGVCWRCHLVGRFKRKALRFIYLLCRSCNR